MESQLFGLTDGITTLWFCTVNTGRVSCRTDHQYSFCVAVGFIFSIGLITTLLSVPIVSRGRIAL